MRRINIPLAGKLVLVLGSLAAFGGSLYWRAEIRRSERNLMESAVTYVSSFSEVVKRSLRHDMLVQHQEHLRKTLESVGAIESIDRVRIFNCNGTIWHSSRPEEEGESVEKHSPACLGCHRDGTFAAEGVTFPERPWTTRRDSSGRSFLSVVKPVYNEPDCYTAPCHHHAEGKQILGILTTDLDLGPIEKVLHRQKVEASLFLLAFLAGSLCLFAVVIWRFVLRPLGAISRGMELVSRGDLSAAMSVPSRDEMGQIAETFNSMTGELREARKRQEGWTQTLEEEVRKKTEQIRNAGERLVQAETLAALGRMTAEVAHEIRNPLVTLGGFARRLQKISSDERERKYADIIVEEVGRLEQILRTVLDFAHMKAPELKRLPLAAVTREALKVWGSTCAERGITVGNSSGRELPVLIDMLQVRQVLDNLIANAIDAMPEGGTLEVDTSSEDRLHLTYAVLQVSDSGPGVPPEKISRIFEPFFTTKAAHRSTGLGLALCRKIVERHGGHIEAENVEGGGFRISLYFPCQDEAADRGPDCWAVMECGRDREGAERCAAFPFFGRTCWAVAGTYCSGKIQGTFAQKHGDCRKCEFFLDVTGMEASPPVRG